MLIILNRLLQINVKIFSSVYLLASTILSCRYDALGTNQSRLFRYVQCFYDERDHTAQHVYSFKHKIQSSPQVRCLMSDLQFNHFIEYIFKK